MKLLRRKKTRTEEHEPMTVEEIRAKAQHRLSQADAAHERLCNVLTRDDADARERKKVLAQTDRAIEGLEDHLGNMIHMRDHLVNWREFQANGCRH